MRTRATLLIAVLLLPLPSTAQEPAGPSTLLEDGTADVQAHAQGTNLAAIPGGRFAATDLVGLSLQESPTDFTFTLAVAGLSSSGETVAESAMYDVRFAHNGVQFRLLAFRTVLPAPELFASLSSLDPGNGRWTWIEQVPVSADVGAGTLSMPVLRDLLLDRDGAAPFPGRSLTGFRVESAGLLDTTRDASISLGPGVTVPLPGARIHDAMPDQGNGTLGWPVRFGLAQTGDARLASLVPVRASNGEATTFVFTVKATNLGPKQLFRLGTSGVPATWQVGLPSDVVELGAGASVDLPILVSTPFAHEHGRLQQFVLEMAGVDDPADVGRVRLGIRYVSPPQPAGHHDTVYLHSLRPEGQDPFDTAFSALFGRELSGLYFNTLAPEDDENDARTPVAGELDRFEAGKVTYTWLVPLSPGLQLGLDFDLGRQGVVRVPVDTVLPMPGAVLSGRLVHTYTEPGPVDCEGGCELDDFYFGKGQRTLVAAIGPTDPQDVPANSKGVQFEAPVAARPAADYLPFQPGATLTLQLNLTFTRVDPFFGPRDAPRVAGGEMTLPLLEYHDPVDQVFSSLSSLMVEVLGEQQRMVNPGKTALYELRLMNHGEADASYDVELEGGNLGWARLLGERRVGIPAGQERTLAVAVTAPASAADGDVSDLVLAAVDARDPTARTLARLLTTVDTDAEHPDDTSRVPGLEDRLRPKGAPGPGLALLAAALAALALARRRG
jgi:hypothetical protein